MSTRTRFEKEAKGNSEMAYWSSSIPARSLELQQKLNQVRDGEISK